MGRNSPHYRHYDKFRRSQISIAPAKTDYAYVWDDAYWNAKVADLEEYVRHDDGAAGNELCMRSLCVKPSHAGKCVAPND